MRFCEMRHRCPFCDFARDPIDGDADYSHVRALKEIAVHIILKHPGEFQELVETASSEWDGRFHR